MSLILAGVIALSTSGVIAVRRWLKARSTSDASVATKDGKAPEEPLAENAPAKPQDSPRLGAFMCQLGDVIVRLTGEEAWLAGAVVLAEEVDIAALFVAPDAGGDRAIYVLPPPHEELWWLAQLDQAATIIGGDFLSAIELDTVRFERVRRLPLRARPLGEGSPEVGDSALVAEYASAGADRLLVLKGSSGKVFAYRGLELAPGSFEVIASGAATLNRPATSGI